MSAMDLFRAADALSRASQGGKISQDEINKTAENLRKHSEDIINNTTTVYVTSNPVNMKVKPSGSTKPVPIKDAPPPKVKAAPSAAEAAKDPKKADARAKHLARPRDKNGRIIPDEPSPSKSSSSTSADQARKDAEAAAAAATASGSGSEKGSGSGAGDLDERGYFKLSADNKSMYDYGESIKNVYKNPDGSVVSDKQFQNYLLNNPDLREHTEALGLYGAQAANWGRWHWDTFGKYNDKRINTPTEIKDPGLMTKVWSHAKIPQVYKDLGLKTTDDILKYSLGTMTPSELWEVREALGKEGGADWSLESFDPEGWRYEADNPYAKGLLGGTLLLNKDLPGGKPIGQLVDEDDLRFLQDRYNDAFIQNDFPDTWISPDKEWTGPKGLEGYWNTMTNAYRDAAGDLRSAWDRPDQGWYGFDSGVPIGPRGGGGIGIVGGGSGSGSQFGGGPMVIGGVMLGTPYTQPAPQDWSGIMPTDRRLQSQRELVDNQGLLYQPWASGQAIAPNLLNYQVPSGSPSNPVFDPSLAGNLIGGSAAGTGDTIINDGSDQDFVYTHPSMNPSNPALNAWLTANPMTDGRFSTALDWNESLYDWSPFGDVRTTPDVYTNPTADTNPITNWY